MADMLFNYNPDAGVQDQLVRLYRDMNWYMTNLNHQNVRQLYTEFCDIRSEAGETVIDGPQILMYSATDSTTLRLEAGYNGSQFVFKLYNAAGDESIYLDSSGDVVFGGSLRTSEEAYIGRNIYINNATDGVSTSVYRGMYIDYGTTHQVALVNDASGGAFRINFYAAGMIYGNNIAIRSSAPGPPGGQVVIDSTYGSVYLQAASYIGVYGREAVELNSTVGSIYLNASSWIIGNCKAMVFHCSGGDITLDATGGNIVLKSSRVCIDGTATTDRIVKGTLWDNWVPTYTWTGGTPGAVQVNVARYRIFERNCWFKIDYEFRTKIGGPITDVSITFPRAASTVFTQTFNCYLTINSTYGIRPHLCFGSSDGDVIMFNNFPSISTSTEITRLFIEGMYETT
jgi:hypothetical protein